MSDKKYKIYLSFKNKATAEKWLKSHGINVEFDESRLITVLIKNNRDGAKSYEKD